MSAQSNLALVRRFFDEVCDAGKLDLADRLFSIDHVYHDPIILAARGPEGIKRVIAPQPASITQTRWTVDALIAGEGDTVTARWTGGGVHTGEVMGVAPTNKRVTVSGVWIFRIDGDEIVESWNLWDALGMARQIGAVPAPAHST